MSTRYIPETTAANDDVDPKGRTAAEGCTITEAHPELVSFLAAALVVSFVFVLYFYLNNRVTNFRGELTTLAVRQGAQVLLRAYLRPGIRSSLDQLDLSEDESNLLNAHRPSIYFFGRTPYERVSTGRRVIEILVAQCPLPPPLRAALSAAMEEGQRKQPEDQVRVLSDAVHAFMVANTCTWQSVGGSVTLQLPACSTVQKIEHIHACSFD